jgi:Na+-transporting NADH:ubiquinone oxidoreductase subunit C
MDTNKNSYTFIFAAVMVVVVAALLSFAATSLKPMQDDNVRKEKMQSILRSVNIDVDREQAEQDYKKYITQELVLRNGKLVEGVDAFKVDLSKEIKKPAEERDAPLYIASIDGETYYIIPLRGKGLWGPIWGYMALEKDANTVYGAIFDHKTETPGLGAEIATPMFAEQFVEKKILDADREFVSIQVMKGNAAGEYQVDGISGGTITSVGVQDMIQDNVKAYFPFLLNYEGNATQSAAL